jgi:hypothetical protein
VEFAMTTKTNILVTLLILPLTVALAQDNIAADPERMEQRIKALSEFGANEDGGVDRVAFSEADIAGRAYIMDLMKGAGLETSVDTAGNIIGRREGSEPDLPPILFGSHIDSVPGGGNYDGDVGVIGAIEVIELLEARSVRTRHPLEVVVFSDEEGGLTGSRAMIGKMGDDTLSVMSHSGMTIGEGIRALGGDPDRLDLARREPGEVMAFLELHIGDRYWCCRRHRRYSLVGRHDRRLRESCGHDADESALGCHGQCRGIHIGGQPGGDQYAGITGGNSRQNSSSTGRTQCHPGRGRIESGDSRSLGGKNATRV